jgi:hypothetical protein
LVLIKNKRGLLYAQIAAHASHKESNNKKYFSSWNSFIRTALFFYLNRRQKKLGY